MSEKAALITGGSKGIGAAIAEKLVLQGTAVMLVARKEQPLRERVAELRKLGTAAVEYRAGNAGNPDDIAASVADTLSKFSSLDYLINNAATSPYHGPLIEVDLPRLDKTLNVNLRGPLLWCQEAWRAWMSRNGGSILNISSIGGQAYTSDNGPYTMTKAGLDYLTRYLAVELAPGVRVNAIAPGLVQTEKAEALWNSPNVRIPPMGRVGQPEDVAAAAMYLLSDDAGWVTGQVLDIDGGARITDFERYRRRAKPATL
ncbi:SDR family oxidoreductase [Nocardia sp. CA-135953]|uniref:SDR family oxidoreductase n=1 Tax=Nocardia sp. CA-135953 TaxID=3239978 RepID=UPI003D9583AB